jgi:acetylornithine/N-succinyldiaminopimelate aminotransferase
MGEYLRGSSPQLASRHPSVRDVRGAGLIWGLELDRPALPAVDAGTRSGLLINRTSDTVIRLLPPYIITTREIDEGVALLDAALTAAFPG